MAIYHQNGNQLIDHLRAMIASGTYPTNSKLPSLRQLAAKFDISVGTVQRCIAELENDGLVTCCHGAGVFVRQPEKTLIGTGQYHVALKLERNPAVRETYCAFALNGIQEACTQYDVLLAMDYRFAATPESLTEAARGNQALLLLGAHYDMVLSEARVGCPVVGVEMALRHGGLASTISLDPFAAAELATEYFFSRNCRRVQVVAPPVPLHIERSEVFQSIFTRHGGACRMVLSWDRESTLELSPQEGLLFPSSDFFHHRSLRHQEKHGRHLGEDYTVLTLDGKPFLIPGREPASTVLPDWVDAGRAAMTEVMRRLQNPGSAARRIFLDCTLKEYDFKARRYQ